MNKVKEIQCSKCGGWHTVEAWDKYNVRMGIDIRIEDADDRFNYWFYCPSCTFGNNMEQQYSISVRYRHSLHGMANTDVIVPMVEYHPGATSADLQLVNVLYEQALQQAELRVEIEEALERFDMDEYYKLVARYREGEKLGAKIG